MAQGLIPKHGGYRKLKSFQVSEVIYDTTVRFCEKYVDRFPQLFRSGNLFLSGRSCLVKGAI